MKKSWVNLLCKVLATLAKSRHKNLTCYSAKTSRGRHEGINPSSWEKIAVSFKRKFLPTSGRGITLKHKQRVAWTVGED